MIKRNNNGYEYFECPRCGSEVNSYDDYCDTCGYPLTLPNFKGSSSQVLEDTASEGEKICQIVTLQINSIYAFTELKIESFRLPNGLVMMSLPIGKFYVFNIRKYPYLSTGSQININFDSYESFRKDGYTIYYDKRDFTLAEIRELQTYKLT